MDRRSSKKKNKFLRHYSDISRVLASSLLAIWFLFYLAVIYFRTFICVAKNEGLWNKYQKLNAYNVYANGIFPRGLQIVDYQPIVLFWLFVCVKVTFIHPTAAPKKIHYCHCTLLASSLILFFDADDGIAKKNENKNPKNECQRPPSPNPKGQQITVIVDICCY